MTKNITTVLENYRTLQKLTIDGTTCGNMALYKK